MNNTNGSPPAARHGNGPGSNGGGRDNRPFVETVLWMARSRSPWRDLPPDFGPWSSVPALCHMVSGAAVVHGVC
ncbi:transposase [Cupriavidus basilensis]